MRILYIAKHGCGLADDEGAIAYAMEQLGHEVIRAHERDVKPLYYYGEKIDLVLFHKWQPTHCRSVPMVFWYFDLVRWPDDPTLSSRNNARMRWMREVCPKVDLGFCTDGDWVDSFNPMSGGKLVWLPQGADERVVGMDLAPVQDISILLTGIKHGGGRGRIEFINWCEANYGKDFKLVKQGVYREQLRGLIARSKIVLCPDSPVTDRYWSNRVYNALGFGAAVLHPYCHRLAEWFEGGKDLIFYYTRDDLKAKIDHLLNLSSEERRKTLGVPGLSRVQTHHLYRHRCQSLLNTVKERLGVG